MQKKAVKLQLKSKIECYKVQEEEEEKQRKQKITLKF